MAPGAASTINNDESVSGEPFHMLPQLLDHCRVGGRTEKFRSWNMGLGIRKSKANINEERSSALG
jgi:hypothetical protein